MVLKNIYFIISLSLIGLLTLLPSAWFIYFDKNFFYFLILSLNFFYIYRVFIKKESFFSVSLSIENRLIILLLLISFLLMVFLPIQNLNLGDGVILLEHVALEAKIFGFHLTMDEILEALIHSVIYAKFQNYFNTPMEVYRIISTIAGFLGILLIYYYFKKFKNSFLSYLLVFTSGGIYLFHGYSENYTLVTLMIWFYILFSIDTIRSNTHRNMKALIPICIIASFLILFHLVSGYLIFSLIYLCYYFSEDKKFIRNAIFSTVFSLVIILPVFIYFIFYANVRFDFSQTHLTNPKFYPISKIISTVHLRDILFCLFGSCLLPFLLIIYALIFDKDRLKKLLKLAEFKFLFFVFIGFMIHGIVHYPQLGFPADWDLLAFFWSPILFISVYIWEELYTEKMESKRTYATQFIGFFVFGISVFLLNAISLNQPSKEKYKELELSLNRIEQYSNSKERETINVIEPANKKFYLSVSFFLFESKVKILNMPISDKSKLLIDENQKFSIELEEHKEKIESKWQKDFYKRLTKYHLDYLDFINKKG